MFADWLKSLGVGDEVCYHSQWHGDIITKVAKITPTGQVKTENGKTFKNGTCKVDSWTFFSLKPVTKEVLEGIEKRTLASFLDNIKWGTVQLEKMREIKQIIQRPEAIGTNESA